MQESKLFCVGGIVWHKWHEMKQLSIKSCEIELLIEVKKYLGQARSCLYLPDYSGRNRKLLITNTIQLKYLRIICM